MKDSVELGIIVDVNLDSLVGRSVKVGLKSGGIVGGRVTSINYTKFTHEGRTMRYASGFNLDGGDATVKLEAIVDLRIVRKP